MAYLDLGPGNDTYSDVHQLLSVGKERRVVRFRRHVESYVRVTIDLSAGRLRLERDQALDFP
jgi:hypothetical protein